MRTRSAALVAAVAVAILGCGKKRELSAEVRECSAIALDANATAQCLVQLYKWSPADARRAAVARHRELDSLKRWQEDSVWALGAAKHKSDLAACRRNEQTPLEDCLLASGWPLPRASMTVDSVWQTNSAEHRREVQACQRRRDVNLASCLTLYYKWESDRALHTADSITRERLGGRTR